MIFTNKLNLPLAFVNAVSGDRHNKKDCVSVTTLLKGTKEIILNDRHHEEIEVDVSQNVWQLFGTAVHSILEKQNTNEFKEEYFSFQVGQKKVTGRIDSYDLETGVLTDYKTASIWKCKFNDFSDWSKQGIYYSWLMSQNGLEVKRCRFIAFLKDWSATNAKREADYPQQPVYIHEFDITKEMINKAQREIEAKVKDIVVSELLTDDEITPCSKDERWATDDKWALMKEGRKSAIKLFDTKEEAQKRFSDMGIPYNHYIEERKGESKKCRDYCSCNAFCNFYLNENNLQKPVEPKVLTSKDLKKHFHDENKRNKNTCDWCLTKTKELTKVASRLFDGENDLVCEDCLRDSEIEKDAFSNEY